MNRVINQKLGNVMFILVLVSTAMSEYVVAPGIDDVFELSHLETNCKVTMPYYIWNHRGAGEMKVWPPIDRSSIGIDK